MKIAIFPGSFDPLTLGHVDIINKALPLFDKIIIGIGSNTEKKYMFALEQRKAWIEKTFNSENKIEVKAYNSLTVDFCKQTGANYIIRGLRSAKDFEYEKPIAHLNHELNNQIETIFLLASEKYTSVSSTIIRDILNYGGDVSKFVPQGVATN